MSVTITKRPLLPVIEITKNDAMVYTFNHFTSTYDFRVKSLQFEPPYDSGGGKFDLRIYSSDVSNVNANTFLTNVKAGNEVAIWVGKTDAGKTKLFLGMIEDIEVVEPNKNLMELRLTGPDWGSAVLKNRIIRGEWRQKFLADGVSLDSTDTLTKISQIATDVLTDLAYYPAGDFAASDQGVVVTAANIKPIDIPLAQFTANYEKLDDKLGDLDKVGASVHYVNPSKNFIMKQASVTTATKIFLTDDPTDATAVAWSDQTGIGLILPNSSYKYSLETHKRRIFGLGGDQTDQIDQSKTTDASQEEFYTQYIAMRFTPLQNNVYDIAVKLSKTGTPTVDPVLELWEEAATIATNTPMGTNLKSVGINRNAITGTANWHLFSLSEKLSRNTNYWIIMRKTGDATNHFRWHHDNVNNGTSLKATSTAGVLFTLATTNKFYYTFRQYFSTPLSEIVSYGISATAKHFYESVIKEADITKKQLLDTLLITESQTAFKLKEIFKGMIYAPDTLIQTGDKIRIRKNSSGLVIDNSDYVVGSVTHIFQSSDDLATGTYVYDIIASRFSSFT